MVAFNYSKKRFDNLDLKEFDLIIDLQSKIRNTLILKNYLTKISTPLLIILSFLQKKLNIPKTIICRT